MGRSRTGIYVVIKRAFMHGDLIVDGTGAAVPQVFCGFWLVRASLFNKSRLEGIDLSHFMSLRKDQVGFGPRVRQLKFRGISFLCLIPEIDFPFLKSLIEWQLLLLSMIEQ